MMAQKLDLIFSEKPVIYFVFSSLAIHLIYATKNIRHSVNISSISKVIVDLVPFLGHPLTSHLHREDPHHHLPDKN